MIAYILHKCYICNCFSDPEIQTQLTRALEFDWFATTHFFLRSSCDSSRAKGAIKFTLFYLFSTLTCLHLLPRSK